MASTTMKSFTLSDGTYNNTLLIEDATARAGLLNKVDKETGKGLSTNDYTDAEKTKLAGIAAGATANIGTVTAVKVNGTTNNPNSSGVVDLGNISGGGGGGDVNVIEIVKVNGMALTPDSNKAVNIDDIPWSMVSSKPTIPDISGKADKVSGATNDNIAALDANGNLKDAGVSASNVSDAVSKRHSHSNKTVLDNIPSSLGSPGQVLTSDGTELKWQTPSSGGLTDYDYTHTISSGVSGTVSVSFSANKRCSVMYGATADIALAITCNNGADNYIWVKNNGNAAIDITISSMTYNNTSLAASKIFLPADGISVDKGCVCEIGVLCNADGAFITARGDLKASS